MIVILFSSFTKIFTINGIFKNIQIFHVVWKIYCLEIFSFVQLKYKSFVQTLNFTKFQKFSPSIKGNEKWVGAENMDKIFHCICLQRSCIHFSQNSYRNHIKNNKIYVFCNVSIIYITKCRLSTRVLLVKIYKFLYQLAMANFYWSYFMKHSFKTSDPLFHTPNLQYFWPQNWIKESWNFDCVKLVLKV